MLGIRVINAFIFSISIFGYRNGVIRLKVIIPKIKMTLAFLFIANVKVHK